MIYPHLCCSNSPPWSAGRAGVQTQDCRPFSCHSLPTPWTLGRRASLHGCFRSRRRSPHTSTVLLERFIKQTNLDGSLVAKAPFNLRLASLRRNIFFFMYRTFAFLYVRYSFLFISNKFTARAPSLSPSLEAHVYKTT